MIKLCATLALACVLTAAAGGARAEAASSAYAVPPEARARAAVAPLVVERAVCVAQSRRRIVCLLAHAGEGGHQCRSTVVVRPRRVRVVQRNVCFVFTEVNP